jgi:hypothetical protein
VLHGTGSNTILGENGEYDKLEPEFVVKQAQGSVINLNAILVA